MSYEHENQNRLSPLEQTLGGFVPAAPRVDRDRLMFLAGQASAGPSVVGSRSVGGRSWYWPASSAVLAATSLALAIALVTRPAPQPLIVQVPAPAPVQPSEAVPAPVTPREPAPAPRQWALTAAQPAAGESYVKSRELALRMGLDALGAPRSSGSSSATSGTYRSLLEGLAGGAPAAASSPKSESLHNM